MSALVQLSYRGDRLTWLLTTAEAMLICLVFTMAAGGIQDGAVRSSTLDVYGLAPAALLIAAMIGAGVYRTDARHNLRLLGERVCLGAVLGAATIAMLHWAAGFTLVAPDRLVPVVAIGACGLILSRWLSTRLLMSGDWTGSGIVLVGQGRRAAAVHRACIERVGTRLPKPTDVVPLNEMAPDATSAQPVPLAMQLISEARQRGAKEIVLALDEQRDQAFVDALIECRVRGIRVTDGATFLERETGKVEVDAVGPDWLLLTDGFYHGRIGAVAKRALDITVALALLMVTSPLMLLISVLIPVDSKGPVFYSQLRVGRDNRPFSILKFRSMVTDAEGDGRARWASLRDHRITRVGRFIRRARIDELPQLVNVLRGEMSLIGPRPERPEFVAQLIEQVPLYGLRHLVKPGLTGWAQINFDYGASLEDAKEKLRYDLFYVKNQSRLLDLAILVQTIRIVLRGAGAR